MFDIDDVDEAKRMLPIYKRAVDLLETVSGEKTEQAEQEPVAYAPIVTFLDAQHYSVSKQKKQEYCNPLYAAPVRTKDLTDDEIHNLVKQVRFDGVTDKTFQFARAIIAADREKNRGS